MPDETVTRRHGRPALAGGAVTLHVKIRQEQQDWLDSATAFTGLGKAELVRRALDTYKAAFSAALKGDKFSPISVGHPDQTNMAGDEPDGEGAAA